MNNQPAERTQTDGLQDFYSSESGLDCSGEADVTRQEFKDDADINNILRKFGVLTNDRQPLFQGTDYNLDLQQALSSIAQAKAAHGELPENLRARYPTWQSLLTALDNGSLSLELEEPPTAVVPA